MANMFADIARKATTISPLIEGKTKISVSDIISTYKDGITINGFDMVAGTDNNGAPSTYPIIVFAEDDSKFAFGGMVLKNVCLAWLEHFDGDIDTCNAALKANGGVKVLFSRQKTRNGREVTTVDVVPTI